jgi:outer membrane protein assembly factor BamB
MIRHIAFVQLLLTLVAGTAWGQALVHLQEFDPPARTDWAPEGCRDVAATPAAIPSRIAWRNLHADVRSSDEVSRAIAPVFEADWIGEPGTYNPTGPVFDSEGNLYFAPMLPFEPVVLISLDPADGSRRWAIPATSDSPVGFSTPIVLADPTLLGKEAIFLVLYDRAVAVRPDGSVIWDVPTGLPGTEPSGVIGIQYHAETDSIVAVSTDGFLVGLDRKTGAQLIPPMELPGSVTPTPPPTLPPIVQQCATAKLQQFADLASAGLTFQSFLDLLLGNGIEVANSFSIDPNTGRLIVAATAPDEADGSADGISQLGALFGIDVVPTGAGYAFSEVCRADFTGGTAATPTLKADGTRVYTADNFGALLAFDASDCSQIWSVDLGAQIFGSVGVATDDDVLYASTTLAVQQVFDRGDHAELGWAGDAELFDIPPPLQPVLSHFNLLLAGIGANGVSVQVGVGVPTPPGQPPFPISQAAVLLDRETGEPRWAAEGLDESVAVMSTGPDGGSYIGNSPLRRLLTRCLLELVAAGVPIPFPNLIPPGGSVDDVTPPLVGGIAKYAPRRLDLLVRDGACAAADRARNAADVNLVCADSVAQDITQIAELIDQAQGAAATAIADGDLTRGEWQRANRRLLRGEFWLLVWKLLHPFGDVTFALDEATRQLDRACTDFDE